MGSRAAAAEKPAAAAHFATGTSAAPGAVTVQGPVRNPLTGDWTWLLARPIALPGVGDLQAVAEVPVSFITTLLSPVGEIPGLRIYIERPDGLLLASLPHDELKIGRQVVPAISNLGQTTSHSSSRRRSCALPPSQFRGTRYTRTFRSP